MILKTKNERIAVAGMLLALGILLPFATSHGFGIPGTVLLPMHIPVLLCGILCGPVYGGLCGLLLPVLNSFLTGLPGILIQLLLIPPVIFALGSGRKRVKESAVRSAINLIKEGTASCVVIKENTIIKTQCDRGIGPIIRLYESGILADTFVVDKIIGKAAAMVLTLGGVKGCYGVTMSAAAVKWLKEHHVSVQYDECVEAIMNRAGDGICPMEQTVKELEDAEEALVSLKEKITELRAAERR